MTKSIDRGGYKEMKKYSSCAVERVHLVKCVPRSYDMSRTHIIHKSVNRRVDVILRCAPKNWKKKRVRVTIVKNGKKREYVRIRVNAKKGYIAVKKAVNHDYDAERKNISAFDEKKVVRYDKVKAANRALIHDMKSQLAVMAKKSADYIENQLTKPATQPADVQSASVTVPTSPVSPTSDNYESALKSAVLPTAEQSTITAQPTAKASPDANHYNPYAADYSKHFSDAEFHALMDSLEKSLDEACRKQGIGFAQPEPVNEDFVKSSASGYPCNAGARVSANSDLSFSSWNAANQSAAESPTVEEYKPVPVFPKDEDEEYKPVTIFPKDEDEEYKPVSAFPQQNPSEMYNQPQTFAPQQQINYNQSEASGSVDFDDGHERQTFFSRTGDQIKKVIGIIRGKTSKKHNDEYTNENVEITYSDDDNDPYRHQ